MFVKMSYRNPPNKSRTLLVPHAKPMYILVRPQLEKCVRKNDELKRNCTVFWCPEKKQVPIDRK